MKTTSFINELKRVRTVQYMDHNYIYIPHMRVKHLHIYTFNYIKYWNLESYT